MTWLRVRKIRVALAIWALLGALMHAGWAPHHTLMRAGLAPVALAAAEAAIEAADASICRADLTQSSPTHPAGKMTASSCPVCSLYAACAVKANADAFLLAHWAPYQAVRFAIAVAAIVPAASETGLGARGPPRPLAA